MPNNPNPLPPRPPSAPPLPPEDAPEPMSIDGEEEDAALASSTHLTHEELVTRRCRRVKQLTRVYRAHYWAMMEELKAKYKEYYWTYGRSPFKEVEEASKENGKPASADKSLGFVAEEEEGFRKCLAAGCKAKAMALTRFCHLHILADSKQTLYKGCAFVIKSSQGRAVLCGKPILRSTVPAFCPDHFQKAERYLARALKKAGLNVASPSTVAPKFHVLVTEFVRHIQTKRRAAQKEIGAEVRVKQEKVSEGS
ncbi:hypothetical protein Tsubulata_030659 [Turnera subulata]|uniref:KANL2-like probable zinc-finger domain-containing protein n=1 Tax=Turnera subulata TaxID=218843 RepID=A0A9Q0FSZ7_9ROSI|nr:hypothetical protein Tsubulata_030659 [Turnera subulata]